MPIEALPQATVRAIGSTSVISDPSSVVKELIDNALDAGASSIFIEISTNTLDVIQVKDNGHGIPTEDHANVCKHTFTSKIRTAEDLRNVGGSSLGFRGEALASVAEMSGGITVTTSVASNVTGSCIKYQRDGEFLQSKPTAHPVGTTVRVIDFLKHIPVRRQVVLKSATKILTKIKKLLQSYAIAQPEKRFSLKVLKAKNENNNWMYASTPGATLSDAASKIFGRELAASCILKDVTSKLSSFTGNHTEGDENTGPDEYHLVCFLPKADSDMAKVNSLGQFLSVDGRPLSNSAGIGQEIARVFKSHIRAAASKNETTKSIVDPFLCLQLSCPPGSYDVNIEPSKDDVLFEERDFVLSMIEDLFDDYYGKIQDPGRKSPVKKKSTTNADINRTFDLLLSQAQPNRITLNTQHRGDESPVATPAQPALRSPASPKYTRAPFKSPQSTHDRENARESQGSRSMNPWSVSRMNASLRTPRRTSDSHNNRQGVLSCDSTPGNQERSPTSTNDAVSPESPELPSPPASRFVSTSPINRRRQASAPDASPPQTDSISSARKAARQRDKERYGNGALDTWFMRTTQASIDQEAPHPPIEDETSIPTISQLAAERFGGPLKDSEPVAAVGHDTTQAEQASVVDETPQPTGEDGGAVTETGYQGSVDSGRGFPVLERWAANLKEGLNPEKISELERALDFETRKKEAMRAYRAGFTGEAIPLSSQESTTSTRTPHHNRFLKAKAALASDRPFAIDGTASKSMSVHDPRAYLIRNSNRQASADENNPPRLLTSKLPFERIPEGYDIHDTGLVMSGSELPTKETLHSMIPHDSYVRDGSESTLTVPEAEELAPFWTERLQAIIKQEYKAGDGPGTPDLPLDLLSVMTAHLKQLA